MLTKAGVNLPSPAPEVPSPNCPTKLSPQHITLPLDNAPQECSLPAEIETNFSLVLTKTGLSLCVSVPSPNCPSRLSPQHITLPLDNAPQECSPFEDNKTILFQKVIFIKSSSRSETVIFKTAGIETPIDSFKGEFKVIFGAEFTKTSTSLSSVILTFPAVS